MEKNKTEQNNVWTAVAIPAVAYMDSQENPVTKEDVVAGVIASGKASMIPIKRITELVDSMLMLFVQNGILVNDNGVYTKRTIQDVYKGRGIEIEYRRKENEKKHKRI